MRWQELSTVRVSIASKAYNWAFTLGPSAKETVLFKDKSTSVPNYVDIKNGV